MAISSSGFSSGGTPGFGIVNRRGAAFRPGALAVVGGGTDPLPLPASGLIRLRAVAHPTIGLIAELDGPVTTPTGYGSTEIIARPQRVGITSYEGRSPLTLRIPLIFDGWSDQRSVEDEIRTIETMLGQHGLSRTPELIIEGRGVPHSYQRDPASRWTLSGDPDWGDDIRMRPSDGHRVFQQLVVSAVQVSSPTTLVDAEPAATSRVRKFYTVTYKGPVNANAKTTLDTIRKIAKHFKVSQRAVLSLNPKLPRDPDKHLKAGTKVRVI